MIQLVAAGREIVYDVEDTILSVRQSTSLAIVVNELLSNALKHGRKEIEVRFYTPDGYAVLEVMDDGPGFPHGFNPRESAHTGLELVENLSRWDLGGEVRYETRPEGGGKVTVTIPNTRTAMVA